MSVITFISHDGEKYETPLEEGQSLMQIAISNLIPGIDGDCGGEAACGTCTSWWTRAGSTWWVDPRLLRKRCSR